MPLYDFKCRDCNHIWEVRQSSEAEPPPCPECTKRNVHIYWGRGFPSIDKAKDPYDYLDGRIPDPKPIKSFANDHRKGGKDTT